MSINIQQLKRHKHNLDKHIKDNKRRPNASKRVVDQDNNIFNSHSEYAEYIGRTRQAVSIAIKQGRLPTPYNETYEKNKFIDDDGDEWESLYSFCKYYKLNFRKSYYNIGKGRSAIHGQEDIFNKNRTEIEYKQERLQRQIDAEIYMENQYGLNGQSKIYNRISEFETDDMDSYQEDLQEYLKEFDT